MLKFNSILVYLGCLGLIQCSSLGFAAKPTLAATDLTDASTDSTTITESESVRRLAEMFSPEIQSIISACQQNGKVDVAAGASEDGAAICGDGSSTEVAYTDYIGTISDILAASSLVGFRAVVESDPRVSSEMVITFLGNSQGTNLIRQAVQSAITRSQLLPTEAGESNSILTDEVINRIQVALQAPTQLDNLLGTSSQYEQVVNHFCTAPGMSIEAAKALVPELSAIQLYAICIQESGVTDEVLEGTEQGEE
jgi:hypothetical protein